MKIKKNKRTLKKRIRKAISWSIFISIFMFGAIIMYFGLTIFKSEAVIASQNISKSTAQNLNSEMFLKAMGITDLKNLDTTSKEFIEWTETLRQMEHENALPHIENILEGEREIVVGQGQGSIRKELQFKTKDLEVIGAPGIQDKISIQITLNGKEIYISENWNDSLIVDGKVYDKEDRKKVDALNRILKYLNTEYSSPLYDTNNVAIGEVTTRVNDYYMLGTMGIIIAIILLVVFVLLIATTLISRFFTIPIITPISQLEEKVKAIAAGDFNATMNTQITIKKPLREIESLADSTNIIMNKMSQYSSQLEEQKQQLEAQNAELEAQNTELAESKRQIEEAQSQLVQSENMASIGQLTAAITHEINTPLGAINSNVQMCDMILQMLLDNPALADNEELKNSVIQLKDANQVSMMGCERVNQIIKSLKNFSKLDQADFQEADINEGIRSVLVLTSNLWKRKVSIHEDYGVLTQATCYPGLLNQVFMNIIVNAIQSIQDNGEIYIHTWQENEQIRVSIRDTGCGIQPELLDRIFEPGFTTKKEGSLGMGLGLSISRNIIRKHHGDIKVNSEPGKGTEFIVCVPLGLTKDCCEGGFHL